MGGEAFIRRAETAESIHKAEHPGYEFTKRTIVGKGESEHFDISVYEVPPGKAAVPYHFHLRNEEVFFILRGTGLLKSPEGERTVTAGDFLYFPNNEKGAHKITNTSETENAGLRGLRHPLRSRDRVLPGLRKGRHLRQGLPHDLPDVRTGGLLRRRKITK